MDMFGRKISGFGGLCAALVLFGSCPARGEDHHAPDYHELGEQLEASVAEGMKKASAAGLSIAVVDPQGAVWAKGFGFADKTQGTPATVDTLYRAVALSPQITATEILRRVEHGEARLDDPLTAHLPGFAIRSRFAPIKPITIRALLAHHAGLPSSVSKGSLALRLTSAEAAAGLMARQEQLRSEYLAEPPQTHLRISALGYSLLGRVIEVKSGRSFAEAMDSGVLQPLGMSHSTFTPAGSAATAGLAKPYRAGAELGAVEMSDRPSGSLIASAADAARFVRFILNDGKTDAGQPLLKPETLKTMFEPQFAGAPMDFGNRSGLGWALGGAKVEGAGQIAHSMAVFSGYASEIMVSREQQLGVVVLSNDDAAGELALKLARRALEVAVAIRRHRPIPGDREPEQARPAPFPGVNLEEIAGDYAVMGQTVRMDAGDGRLVGEISGKRIELIPVAKDRFIPQLALLGSIDVFGLFKYSLPAFSVRPATVGGRRFAVLEGLPQTMAFERIARGNIPAAWLARAGKYRCDNPDPAFTPGEATLADVNGLLTLTVTVSSKPLRWDNDEHQYTLIPVSANEAVVAGVNYNEGGTVRAVERDGRVALVYSGFSITRQK
jgi:CubicO group peptidase (beta-lactamase class C family)